MPRPVNPAALATVNAWATEVFAASHARRVIEDAEAELLTPASFRDTHTMLNAAKRAHDHLPEPERQRLGLYGLELGNGEWVLRKLRVLG